MRAPLVNHGMITGWRGGLRRVVRRLAGAALAAMVAFPTLAQEVEIRALQTDLRSLGLYTGPIDGEQSERLDAAIGSYVRDAGFRAPAQEAFRDFGRLVRDVDVEVRIRSGALVASGRQVVRTRRGDMTIIAYAAPASPQSVIARRVSVDGQRIDAGLAAMTACCDTQVFAIGTADVIVLQGVVETPGCEPARLYVSILADRISVADGDGSCTARPAYRVHHGTLEIRAKAPSSHMDAVWTLTPGGTVQFDRLAITGSLDPLVWWVGRQPYEKNERGYRLFHFAPLSDALAALLEPEPLGWVLKMSGTSPVERQGDMLFVTIAHRQDENLVVVSIDLARSAVHVCSFLGGQARFASTLLPGVFADVAASCPVDPDNALAVWSSFGVAGSGRRIRVFGFEGVFGDAEACRSRDDRVTRIDTRRLKLPGEPACAIGAVRVEDGASLVTTSCRTLPIRRLDDDRIDLDGDVLTRCPDSG